MNGVNIESPETIKSATTLVSSLDTLDLANTADAAPSWTPGVNTGLAVGTLTGTLIGGYGYNCYSFRVKEKRECEEIERKRRDADAACLRAKKPTQFGYNGDPNAPLRCHHNTLRHSRNIAMVRGPEIRGPSREEVCETCPSPAPNTETDGRQGDQSPEGIGDGSPGPSRQDTGPADQPLNGSPGPSRQGTGQADQSLEGISDGSPGPSRQGTGPMDQSLERIGDGSPGPSRQDTGPVDQSLEGISDGSPGPSRQDIGPADQPLNGSPGPSRQGTGQADQSLEGISDGSPGPSRQGTGPVDQSLEGIGNGSPGPSRQDTGPADQSPDSETTNILRSTSSNPPTAPDSASFYTQEEHPGSHTSSYQMKPVARQSSSILPQCPNHSLKQNRDNNAGDAPDDASHETWILAEEALIPAT
jgi:hypothetical protein